MRSSIMTAAVLAVFALPACAADSDANTQITTQEDKLSYTIGVDLGTNFEEQQIEIDPNVLLQGITDGLSGGDLLMSDEEMNVTLEQFQQDLMAKRADQYSQLAEQNKDAGEKFLVSKQQEEGIEALPSGVLYKVITDGTGDKPGADDSVTVEYEGKLIDGTIFDSSESEPITFSLSQVIPGWQEALMMMTEGSTWEVFIPADLAYGPQGFGVIGPEEVLTFEIRLISINDDDESGDIVQ